MAVVVTFTLINAVTGAVVPNPNVTTSNALAGRAPNGVVTQGDANGLVTLNLPTPSASLSYLVKLPDGQWFNLPIPASSTPIAIGNLSYYPQGVSPELANITALVSAATGGGSEAAYKVYAASFTQTGTSQPVAAVYENTLAEDEIEWEYVATGQYTGALAGAFPAGMVPSLVGINQGAPSSWQLARMDDNTIGLSTFGGLFDTPADSQLADTFIEIRVYNA